MESTSVMSPAARSPARSGALAIAIPLCLIGLIGAGLRANGTRSVIIVASVTALLTADWPSGTGTLTAVAAGCAAGAVSDRMRRA